MSKQVKKVRISQDQRTKAMKSKLSKAAFDVIDEVGYANFRTLAVSKAAGVSQGAQLHHFPSKNSLAIAAIEFAYKKADEKFTTNIDRFKVDDDPIDALFKDARDFYMSPSFMVSLDILMAGGKDKVLHDEVVKIASTARKAVERAWLEKFIDIGWSLSDAEDVIALTYSLVRGLAVRNLIGKNNKEFSRLLERWKKMVVASLG